MFTGIHIYRQLEIKQLIDVQLEFLKCEYGEPIINTFFMQMLIRIWICLVLAITGCQYRGLRGEFRFDYVHCKSGDIIEMIVNLNELTLSYKAMEYQKKVFEIEKTTYRAQLVSIRMERNIH